VALRRLYAVYCMLSGIQIGERKLVLAYDDRDAARIVRGMQVNLPAHAALEAITSRRE